jgi:hypothetical protein
VLALTPPPPPQLLERYLNKRGKIEDVRARCAPGTTAFFERFGLRVEGEDGGDSLLRGNLDEALERWGPRGSC